ncbi:hypothetical protein AB6F20_15520 [Providencia hangzhouensis]|uniref:hypothetical protein n=1 Tax=Providencia hangzhouensis TaxID=3031799 RepID=UPI0034DCECCA
MVNSFFSSNSIELKLSAFASENSEVKRSNTGVIRFTGAIVAAPCIVEANANKVETKCWNDSGKLETGICRYS